MSAVGERRHGLHRAGASGAGRLIARSQGCGERSSSTSSRWSPCAARANRSRPLTVKDRRSSGSSAERGSASAWRKRKSSMALRLQGLHDGGRPPGRCCARRAPQPGRRRSKGARRGRGGRDRRARTRSATARSFRMPSSPWNEARSSAHPRPTRGRSAGDGRPGALCLSARHHRYDGRRYALPERQRAGVLRQRRVRQWSLHRRHLLRRRMRHARRLPDGRRDDLHGRDNLQLRTTERRRIV